MVMKDSVASAEKSQSKETEARERAKTAEDRLQGETMAWYDIHSRTKKKKISGFCAFFILGKRSWTRRGLGVRPRRSSAPGWRRCWTRGRTSESCIMRQGDCLFP